MTNIKISINGAHASITSVTGLITSGMVGATVDFEFSSEWTALQKTAVFRAGTVTRDFVGVVDRIVVPHEVLDTYGVPLYIGVYGSNADGSIVIPTVWAAAPVILRGADPSGDPGTDPSLPVWGQMQAQIGDLAELETVNKGNLVEAINEAAQSGGGGGQNGGYYKPSITDGVLSWTPSKAGMPAVPPANVQGPKGDKGEPGERGQDGAPGPEGKSAYQVALDNGFTGTESQWLASLVGNGMTPEAQKQLADNTADVSELKQANDFFVTGQLVDNVQNVADNGVYKLYHRADAVLGRYLNIDTASKTIADMANTKYGYVFVEVEHGKQYTLRTKDEYEYVGRVFDVSSGTYTKTSYLWAGWGNSGAETTFTVPDWGRYVSVAFRLKTQADVTGIVNDTFVMWEEKTAEAFSAKVNRDGHNEVTNHNAAFIVSKNAFNTAVGFKENIACYDGVEVARDGYCTTYPFMDLLAGQTYTISKANGGQFLIFLTFYRSDMTFIERWYVDARRGTFTVPADAVYTKASFSSAHLGTFQINEGGCVEPYVPYGEKYALAQSIEVPERIIHVNKDGTGDFTSLTEGILKATEGMDYTVLVGDGVYDLIEEFKSYYGADFFDNHVSGSLKGIILQNRIKIVFSSGSLVRCNYTGSNDSVMIRFSPFNAGQYGFSLINMKLECSRVRYAVHDEMHLEEAPYRNVYEDCDMLIDNSNNTAWAGKACIGGGLGIHGDIVVRDSVFNSVESVDRYLVTYHNSEDANHKGAKSNVVVTGCYIGGQNGINASWFGSSTEITKFVLTNNNVGIPTRVHPETSDGTSPVVNVEVLEWGTVVRGSDSSQQLLDSLKGAASEWEWKNQSLTSSGSVSNTTIRLFSYIPEGVTNIIPQQNVIQRICGWDADGIYLGEFENYQFVKKIAEMSIPFNPQPLRNTYPGIKLAVIIGYAKDASGNADSVSVEDINSLVEFEYAKGTSITEDIKRLNKIIGTMTPGNILRFTADYEHVTHAVTMSVEDVSTLCLNGTTDGVAFIGLNGVTDSGGSRLKWLEPGTYKLRVDLISGSAKYKPKFMLSSSKEVTLDQPFAISDPSTLYVRLEKAWTFTNAKFRCVLEPLDTEEVDADATAVDAYARKRLAEMANPISAENEIQQARAQKLLHPCNMKFLAHRGYKKKAIENTVYAYELAGKYGFDFVNVAQCRQSADGTWWAIHNATTDAISGGTVTGAVADKTDAELSAILSAGKWAVSGMSNVVDYTSVNDFTAEQRRIATVEEVIRICLRYGMGIMLRLGSLPEVINTEADRASWDSFVGLCKKYAIQDSALFSGTIAQLTIMRQYNPNAQISMYGFGAAGAVANAASHGWTENVWLGIDEFTPADIETLHKAGIKVCAGASVATREELAEMAALGVEIASSQFNLYI